MRGVVLLRALSLLSAFIVVNGQNVSPTRKNGENLTFAPGDLIWQDEFDQLDWGKWNAEINMNGGYNNEFQIYDKYGENAYTRDGVLYIRPTLSLDTVFGGNVEQLYNGYLNLEGCTGYEEVSCRRQASYPWIHPPVVSARLRTKDSFSFRYGRVEVRAKMPSGDWTWPAIWMLPETERYGNWPTSGEIDIVEIRGNRKLFDWQGINIGSEQTASTLHFGPRPLDGSLNGFMTAHGTFNTAVDQGYDRDFHIFEVIWNTESMEFKVDGNVVKRIDPPQGGFFELGNFPPNVGNPWSSGSNPRMAPFDENFHFILNVATGGDYFPRETNPPPAWGYETTFLDFFNNRENWQQTWNGENSALAVDYIRVYAV